MFIVVYICRNLELMIKKLEYTDKDEFIFLDKTLLPLKEKYVKTKDYKDVIEGIKTLQVRGAPLIGIAAANGIVLGMCNHKYENSKDYEERFYNLIDQFRKSRPTGKNLFYALARMVKCF